MTLETNIGMHSILFDHQFLEIRQNVRHGRKKSKKWEPRGSDSGTHRLLWRCSLTPHRLLRCMLTANHLVHMDSSWTSLIDINDSEVYDLPPCVFLRTIMHVMYLHNRAQPGRFMSFQLGCAENPLSANCTEHKKVSPYNHEIYWTYDTDRLLCGLTMHPLFDNLEERAGLDWGKITRQYTSKKLLMLVTRLKIGGWLMIMVNVLKALQWARQVVGKRWNWLNRDDADGPVHYE